MVKFIRAPKIVPYTGELELVTYEFVVPVQKNCNSKLTGFEVVDRMIRPVVKGLGQKPMEQNGFKFVGSKRKPYKRTKK